ncbi:MFS general substrate transporter [Pseudovirgaria hyperparasitica]|uniref:MFS general substrate transporter n=1 Tax=Pseudovirgaria hyperparasitica TaxID=470096 RepID=A0A6A6W8T1_9PEZI|nr:MFS general substrate transporter [Pseudovirgaria hyperparasitica]KAF2757491.1 MFS general substrate transporter [Pseudovirgaria hyperparasitica]
MSRSASDLHDDSQSSPQDETSGRASDIAEVEKPQHGSVRETEYVTGFKLVLIVASMALACFLMLLDTMIVSTAVPRITDTFNSLPDVGWYASAYQFGSAAPQPLTGKIYTHFNSKWTFLSFFGIFELGSILCGAAVSSNMLIVGRAIAGFGAAGIINGAITIISSCAPLERRPVLIGITMGLNQLGLVAGPLIGGAFTSYTTWRWCFYVNLPLGAFTAATLVLVRIPEQAKKERAAAVLSKLHHYLDLIGFLLFAPAVLMLLLALQYGGNQYPWSSSRVIGLFCGSGVTFIVWLFWNRHKGDDALIPWYMIRQTVVWSSGLFQALVMSAVYGATFYLPLYFQAINNATPVLSGVYLLPMILPQLFAAGLSGGLIQKFGYVIPLAIVGTILLTVGSGLYSLLQPSSPTGWWVGFQILAGFGSGLTMQLAILTVQAVIGERDLSTGMAIIIFAQSIGPAIFLVIFNVLFLASLNGQLREYAPGADAAAIVRAGATGFRRFVATEDLAGVLVAYSNSVDRVFYLVAGVAAACSLVLWGMGWRDLRKPEEKPKESEGQVI